MGRSADKIRFTSFDDLFGDGSQAKGQAVPEEDQVIRVPLARIHGFRNHPFRVTDDEKMMELVESIKQYGILVPAIVRPSGKDGYELVAGHRRKRGSELAGCVDMPVIVRRLTDDEATIIMVDSNIQREDILPSEKAWAYRMKLEALGHQGSKGEKHTAAQVGEPAGESGRTVQRLVRLTYLKKELLDYVDQRKLSLFAAEKLSYLSEEEQQWVLGETERNHVFPSMAQAERLKEESSRKALTDRKVADILKRNGTISKVTIPGKKIKAYFPADYTKEQIEAVIFDLLNIWKGQQIS